MEAELDPGPSPHGSRAKRARSVTPRRSPRKTSTIAQSANKNEEAQNVDAEREHQVAVVEKEQQQAAVEGGQADSKPSQVSKLEPRTVLQGLKAKWLGRAVELDRLVEFLTGKANLDGYGAPSSVLVLGPAGSGKTAVVLDIIRGLDLDHAYVNAAECSRGAKDLCGILATQVYLSAQKKRSRPNSATTEKGQALARFVAARQQGTHIRNIMNQCKTPEALALHIESVLMPRTKRPFVIIIDDADEPDLVEAMAEVAWSSMKDLARRSKRYLKIVFIARAEDPKLRTGNTIFFEPYQDEIVRSILSQQFALQFSPELDNEFKDQSYAHFRQVFKLASSRFASAVTELDDHAYLMQYLWHAQQIQPPAATIPDGITAQKLHKSKHMVVAVEQVSRRLFHRDCESIHTVLSAINQGSEASSAQAAAAWTTFEVAKRLDAFADRQTVGAAEMPFFAKVLLVAFYMASHNSADYDSILFGGRKRRKKRRLNPSSTKRARDDANFVGPKAFPLERGRWLFRAILTDLNGAAEADKASLGMHRYLESLCSLRLVARCSDPAELNDVRFKCLASRAFCEAVARNLGLELSKYLGESAVDS